MNNLKKFTKKEEELMVQNEFDALLADYINSPHTQRIKRITEAFEFANKAHQGSLRKSGEPYIMHPLAVARIAVKDLGLGSTSICAALLHDVVEDTEYTRADIEERFGKRVASIVDGLTKISGGIFDATSSAQAENFRKLILTIPKDLRVILIKIADRLHNMRTLASMPKAKQIKICGETKYIYAPIAERLGYFLIKTEFENLSFKYEQPTDYEKIERDILELKPQLEDTFRTFIRPIRKILDVYSFDYTLKYRIKSPYSVFNKMQKKNIGFDEVFDLLAIRVIIKQADKKLTVEEEKANCWLTYSALTSIYRPHPERTRDWISSPKSNGYEALHCTVMGPGGNWIEVQIRSERMNKIAEHGIAAHWVYKQNPNTKHPSNSNKNNTQESNNSLDKWFSSIREMLENDDTNNATEFLDMFKMNVLAKEIYIFTPKGDVRSLPKGSTVLDFAYSIHTKIGDQCMAANVDHMIKPKNYTLQSGEQVEIITSETVKPDISWLDIVKTPRARSCIKAIFPNEVKELIERGEELIRHALHLANQQMNNTTLGVILDHYHIINNEELYRMAGNNIINMLDIPKLFKTEALPNEPTQNLWMRIWKSKFGGGQKKPETQAGEINQKRVLKITDADIGNGISIADCCKPIPGDNVMGFLDTNNELTIHKVTCSIAEKLKTNFGNNVISIEWDTNKVQAYPITFTIKGIDASGLLLNMVKVISDHLNIRVSSVKLETNNGVFEGKISLFVYSTEDLKQLFKQLESIKNIQEIKRIS